MKKRIFAVVVAFSFLLSGCSATEMIKERLGGEENGKLSEIIDRIFSKEESDFEMPENNLRDTLEGTWIRGDSSEMYSAKLEISFDDENGKGVLRSVPANPYGMVEGDIKWNNIIFTGENNFEFSELAESSGQSQYVPAEATLDFDEMTIYVNVKGETSASPYQIWVKSGYMAEVQMPEKEKNTEFLFPSDERYITEDDLDGLSKEEVALIRNEIYAKHGYVFNTESYREYFSAKSWYTPNENFSESMLNDIERTNREFIVSYEEKRGWR